MRCGGCYEELEAEVAALKAELQQKGLHDKLLADEDTIGLALLRDAQDMRKERDSLKAQLSEANKVRDDLVQHIRRGAEEAQSLRKRVVDLEKQHAEFWIRFDGSPGPIAGRFVEVETPEGESINVGRWEEAKDDSGHWFLKLNVREKP